MLALALCACGKRAASEEAAPLAFPLGARVVIPDDTRVYDRADADRQPMRLVGVTPLGSGRLAEVRGQQGELVEVRTIPLAECLGPPNSHALRLFVPADRLRPAPEEALECPKPFTHEPDGWHMPPPTEPCEAWVLRAGTSLSWPRGGEAGEATRAQVLVGESVSEGTAGRLCFPSSGLRLCAERSAFDHQPERACAGIEDELLRLQTLRYHAKVRQGVLRVDGDIEDGEVLVAARERFGELSDCYAAGLAQAPELRGRVRIDYVIDGGGAVMSARVHYARLDPPDPTVAPCMVDAILAWRFPVPAGSRGAEVRSPFVLRPR